MSRILRLMVLPLLAVLTLVLPVSAVAAPGGDPVTKTDVCHYDARKDAYKLLAVIGAALPGHFSHGDALPGSPAPLDPGFVLEETCTLAPATEPVVDQNQPVSDMCMAASYLQDLAQSFRTDSSYPTSGAGTYIDASYREGTANIALWDALPNAGGSLLAEGTSPVGNASDEWTTGEWVDVFWEPIALDPARTYYLVLTGSSYSGFFCFGGSLTDTYPFGTVFANEGFLPFPGYDYAFRTWVNAPVS